MIENKPTLPFLIFDGECAFCRLWIEYWKSLTGDRVIYAPFQKVSGEFPEIALERFQKSVQVVMPSGEAFEGAEAVFRALTYAPGKGWLSWMYRAIPGFSFISEVIYSLIAAHRPFSLKVTGFLWGKDLGPYSYFLSRWLFLRLLGVIYFIAFLSFWIQIPGLIGSDGILPAERFLEIVKFNLESKAYWLVPTVAWFNAHDGFLQFLALGGTLLSVLVIFGVLTIPVLVVLWIFYLSLVSAGQVFMSFQWDNLLLEAGFLAIFMAPLQVLPRLSGESPPSMAVLWLFRFLLFRLMFSSGFGKLTSGDPTWRNFTALDFHYFTQPLPTPIAWYMYQLPEWFHKLSVGFMFFIEIVIPFLIFAPRQLRFIAGAGIILLQVFIALTGNYTFFNVLTISLCALLFDDAFLRRVCPKKIKEAMEIKRLISDSRYTFPHKKLGMGILAAIIIFLGCIQLSGVVIGSQNLPRILRQTFLWVSPFRIVNNYGLFRVMTTSRPEIIIEGSNDGENWVEYEFKSKPGNLKTAPPWVQPHQPRLDWQMWFAALGNTQNNPWFVNLMERILQGSPHVLRLLESNPFPEQPPKYLRAALYEYSFTNLDTKRDTGDWWKRELIGTYFYPISSNGD
jgi:predicted DCC family thiol-disulfide oxidoreductase YuxK